MPTLLSDVTAMSFLLIITTTHEIADCVPPPSLGATVLFAPKEKETVSPSDFCHSTQSYY